MSENIFTKDNLKQYDNAKALSELMIKQLGEVDIKNRENRQEFFRFISGFKSSAYSLNNSIMLYAQASQRSVLPVFGSFNEWIEKCSVRIRRGESAMFICMPHKVDSFIETDSEGNKKYIRKAALTPEQQKDYETRAAEGKVQKITATKFFYNPCVFSLTQTTMAEQDRIEYLQRYNAHNDSLENEALYKKLKHVAGELGLNIQEQPITDESLGWVSYGDGALAVKYNLPVDAKCAVYIHEISHYELHRGEAGKNLSHADREIQAELSSRLIMEKLGIDSEKQYQDRYINGYLRQAAAAAQKQTPGVTLEDCKADVLYGHLKVVLPFVELVGAALNQNFVGKNEIDKIKAFTPAPVAKKTSKNIFANNSVME